MQNTAEHLYLGACRFERVDCGIETVDSIRIYNVRDVDRDQIDNLLQQRLQQIDECIDVRVYRKERRVMSWQTNNIQ
jgi:hypothetical protein